MSLPPLPPRRKGTVQSSLQRRTQEYLDKIEKGEANAEEDYKFFLIEEGQYFYSLEEVIPDQQINMISLDDIVLLDGNKRTDFAKAFIRKSAPNYVALGGRNGVNEFLTTKQSMAATGGKMPCSSLASTESKGHSSTAKKRIWAVDIFARPLEEAKGSEVAHLLPEAPDHAIEWYDVACWAIGADPEKADWATVFRLLHGTKGSDKKRVFGSGVRHFVANKARINDQEKVLDKEDPQLLIIPIRSREECLDWNGEDYEAIVLVGGNKDGKSQKWATKTIGLTDNINITVFDANEVELQKALLSLEECTYAMVQSLVNYDPPSVPTNVTEDEKKSMDRATDLRRKRCQSFRDAVDALGTKSVPIPKTGNTGPKGKYRAICKIRFSNDKSPSNYLHPAPDPILLLARAVVIWSVRNRIRLRASDVAPDDDGEEEWENDVLQLELMAKMTDQKQLKESFEGAEITLDQRGMQDSSSEASSVTSDGSNSLKPPSPIWDAHRPALELR